MEQIIHSIDNILKPIEQATGMCSDFYSDASYTSQERDLVLAKGWAALELKSELPEKGHVKPLEFLGLPLLISHNTDGQMRVFHNVCRHRGMVLVTEEKPIEGLIVCPYHSWTYTMDGELKGTPHIAGIGAHDRENFNKGDFGLSEVRSGVFMNVLFINLDGKAEDFDTHFAPLVERWKSFLGEKGYEQMSLAEDGNRTDFEVDANWKLAVENYAEAYHLPSLHPELNATSPLDVHYNILLNENFSGQGTMAYNDPLESNTLPKFTSWPADKEQYAEYMCIYPNLLTGVQNNYAFVILLHPESPTRTIEKLEMFYIGEGATDDKFASARATALDAWSNVFSEDIEAVEGMQMGRCSPYYDGGRYAVPLEAPTHHFHQWVASQIKSSDALSA